MFFWENILLVINKIRKKVIRFKKILRKFNSIFMNDYVLQYVKCRRYNI